jgi:ATP-dependent DNA helicase PIF1
MDASMNEKQNMVLNMIQEGKNVFLTGPAGTGKTFTIRKVIEWLKTQDIHFGITATTGSAALLIGGRTLHSYLGIGINKKTSTEMAKYMRKDVKNKLKVLDFLIIDEISMLNNEMFVDISHLLCIIKGNTEPFGGVQVLLCGDFCQLPPVEPDYAFMCEEWERAGLTTITLTQSYRQGDDLAFFQMLQRLRFAKPSREDIASLRSRVNLSYDDQDINPTRLYALNRDVEKINIHAYNGLVEQGRRNMAYKSTYTNKEARDWADACGIPEVVYLCEGCQVVLTRNLDSEAGLVNGSRGVVVSVGSEGPFVRFLNNRTVQIGFATAEMEQKNLLAANQKVNPVTVDYMPIRLAYALTIHKSQGMTLDAVEIDLGYSIFSPGQAYTALSRAKNLDSVWITKFTPSSFKTDQEVLRFYQSNL